MPYFKSTLDSKYFSKIEDLKKDSIKGGSWSIATQGLIFLLQMVSTAVLGRILAPNDYGLIAMNTAITGFITIFSDFGLTTTTIQSDELDDETFSSIFWLNLAIGVTLSIVFALLSPLISWFYNDDRLFSISLFASLGFFLTGLTSQLLALLKRSMQFRVIMMAQTSSLAMGVICSIVMALNGFGYWALAWSPIVTSIFQAFFLFLRFRWIPQKFSWNEKVKGMVSFGRHVTYFDTINYFSRNLDNVLIGRFMGAVSLGFYSKAYQLLMLPINQIRGPLMNVALPALSSVRNNERAYTNYYMNYISLLALVTCFIVTVLWIGSETVISLILGEKWLEISNIFSILALAAMVQPIYGSLGLVLVSLGNSQKYFRWGLHNAILIITAFLVGINFDLKTFAIIYVVANYISLFYSSYYALVDTPICYKVFLVKIFQVLVPFFSFGVLTKLFLPSFGIGLVDTLCRVAVFSGLCGLYLATIFPDKDLVKKLLNKQNAF